MKHFRVFLGIGVQSLPKHHGGIVVVEIVRVSVAHYFHECRQKCQEKTKDEEIVQGEKLFPTVFMLVSFLVLLHVVGKSERCTMPGIFFTQFCVICHFTVWESFLKPRTV